MKPLLPPVAVTSAEQPLTPTACVSGEPFALQVTDDSMLPEFDIGMVVVIDPSLQARDGDFVVASVNGAATLGRFESVPDGARLHTRVQSWPIAAQGEDVLGVVVQRAGPRRAWHKHYR